MRLSSDSFGFPNPPNSPTMMMTTPSPIPASPPISTVGGRSTARGATASLVAAGAAAFFAAARFRVTKAESV